MRYEIDHYIVSLNMLDEFNCVHIKNLKNNFEYQEIISSNDYQYLKLNNESLYNLLNNHFKNNAISMKNYNDYISLTIKLEDTLDNFKIRISRCIDRYTILENKVEEQYNKIIELEDKINYLLKLIAPTYNIYVDNNNNIYTTNEEIIIKYTQLLHLIMQLIVIATKIDPKFNKTSINNPFNNKISLTNGIIYHFTQNNSSKVVKLFNELIKEYYELFKNEILIFNIDLDKVSVYLSEYDKMTTLIKDKNLKSMVPKIEIPL